MGWGDPWMRRGAWVGVSGACTLLSQHVWRVVGVVTTTSVEGSWVGVGPYLLKLDSPSLAGWLSRLDLCPVDQTVKGLIPGQGTYPGCGFSPPWGHVREVTNQCLSLFLSF